MDLLKYILAKNERKVKRTIYVSIGLIGILFITAILLTILPLNSSVASASSRVDIEQVNIG